MGFVVGAPEFLHRHALGPGGSMHTTSCPHTRMDLALFGKSKDCNAWRRSVLSFAACRIAPASSTNSNMALGGQLAYRGVFRCGMESSARRLARRRLKSSLIWAGHLRKVVADPPRISSNCFMVKFRFRWWAAARSIRMS